jgi:hypothetical protein
MSQESVAEPLWLVRVQGLFENDGKVYEAEVGAANAKLAAKIVRANAGLKGKRCSVDVYRYQGSKPGTRAVFYIGSAKGLACHDTRWAGGEPNAWELEATA